LPFCNSPEKLAISSSRAYITAIIGFPLRLLPVAERHACAPALKGGETCLKSKHNLLRAQLRTDFGLASERRSLATTISEAAAIAHAATRK
jgi:hypothetical protein